MDDIKIFEGDELRYMDSFSDEEIRRFYHGYDDLLVRFEPDNKELVVAASKNLDRAAFWNAYKARFPDTGNFHFGFISSPEVMDRVTDFIFGPQP